MGLVNIATIRLTAAEASTWRAEGDRADGFRQGVRAMIPHLSVGADVVRVLDAAGRTLEEVRRR